MKSDLEEKSIKLKQIVSHYDSVEFLGHISSLIYSISFDKPIEILKGLSSPLRQLYYLANLNITSQKTTIQPKHPIGSLEMWDEIKKIVNEIEIGYFEIFSPKANELIDDFWLHKRQIAIPTFLGYFNMGNLSYDEQTIEKISRFFTPFDNLIFQNIGLHVQDLIEFYNYIDELLHKFINDEIILNENDQTWQEFAQSMIDQEILPEEWVNYLPIKFAKLFDFMQDQGMMHRFKKEDLVNRFDINKVEIFLKIFTVERIETDFLFYTQTNVFRYKPIFKIKDDLYQYLDIRQISYSIYNTLFEFCTKDKNSSELFYKKRGEIFEDMIEDVFSSFLSRDFFTYKSYFTTDKKEQDLLFTKKGLALIIEAKSSKRDEPLRDPKKAYPLILSNFKEVIQKEYDQSYRVKSKFLSRKNIDIFNDINLSKKIHTIRSKNITNTFSIVVTLERFGYIQTNLTELLEVYEDDTFPWSVCIDDLEIILLFLKKHHFSLDEFSVLLNKREMLQGNILSNDELEIFGLLVDERIKEKNLKGSEIIITAPDTSSIFDFSYHTGLGFKNEKRIDMKKDANYTNLGDNSDWKGELKSFEQRRKVRMNRNS